MGSVLFALGFVLLCKVWWSLSFNFSTNINVAGYVALVIGCFCLIWISMALVDIGLHLLSVISFHS